MDELENRDPPDDDRPLAADDEAEEPSQPEGTPEKSQRLEDQLKRFVSSRTFATLVLLFVVAELFFSSGENRENAVRFLEEDIKEPVARLSPFKLFDVFGDEATSCRQGYSYDQCSLDIFRIPGALLAVAEHALDEGILGVLVLGAPALVVLAAMAADRKNDGSILIILHPAFWVIGLLGAACVSWVVQFVSIALIFVIKQLILSFAIISVLLYLYNQYELWTKIRGVAQSWFAPRPKAP